MQALLKKKKHPDFSVQKQLALVPLHCGWQLWAKVLINAYLCRLAQFSFKMVWMGSCKSQMRASACQLFYLFICIFFSTATVTHQEEESGRKNLWLIEKLSAGKFSRIWGVYSVTCTRKKPYLRVYLSEKLTVGGHIGSGRQFKI